MTSPPFIDSALSTEENQHWADFTALLEKSVRDDCHLPLLELLLTPDERALLGTRVEIIRKLLGGQCTQRELKNQLKTGIATITRGSQSLKNASDELKIWLQKNW